MWRPLLLGEMRVQKLTRPEISCPDYRSPRGPGIKAWRISAPQEIVAGRRSD